MVMGICFSSGAGVSTTGSGEGSLAGSGVGSLTGSGVGSLAGGSGVGSLTGSGVASFACGSSGSDDSYICIQESRLKIERYFKRIVLSFPKVSSGQDL